MEQKLLDKILQKHQMWLNDEDGGERANLSYANLSGADLSYAKRNEMERCEKCKYWNKQSEYYGVCNLLSYNNQGANLGVMRTADGRLESVYLETAPYLGCDLFEKKVAK